MKGLLIKDLYMTVKYCRAYFLIAVFFLAVSFFGNDNLFLIFYPCILCGMIPVNLFAYDERSRWLQYSQTMPYTKGQVVGAKYVIGLLAQFAVLLVTGIAQGVRMSIGGKFVLSDYLVMMTLVFILSLLASSICLPFMFKLGVEKGRMAYYIMVGVVCAGSILSTTLLTSEIQVKFEIDGVFGAVCLVGIGLYALSWYLSVLFYKKREL